jgi:hypothetical protein
MIAKKRLVRISCTVPEDVLAEADRIAAHEDRSRSWVISEALRRYGEPGTDSRLVREPTGHPYAAAAIAEARDRQLVANLRLTPTERLARAEDLLQFAREVHPRTRRAQIIGFGTLEDFAAWKAEERART